MLFLGGSLRYRQGSCADGYCITLSWLGIAGVTQKEFISHIQHRANYSYGQSQANQAENKANEPKADPDTANANGGFSPVGQLLEFEGQTLVGS